MAGARGQTACRSRSLFVVPLALMTFLRSSTRTTGWWPAALSSTRHRMPVARGTTSTQSCQPEYSRCTTYGCFQAEKAGRPVLMPYVEGRFTSWRHVTAVRRGPYRPSHIRRAHLEDLLQAYLHLASAPIPIQASFFRVPAIAAIFLRLSWAPHSLCLPAG